MTSSLPLCPSHTRHTPHFSVHPHAQSEVDTESVGHVLCKKADELDAVAIVMASHNKGRMAEFFLGSVCQYCTHHSKRPVVIVPAK